MRKELHAKTPHSIFQQQHSPFDYNSNNNNNTDKIASNTLPPPRYKVRAVFTDLLKSLTPCWPPCWPAAGCCATQRHVKEKGPLPSPTRFIPSNRLARPHDQKSGDPVDPPQPYFPAHCFSNPVAFGSLFCWIRALLSGTAWSALGSAYLASTGRLCLLLALLRDATLASLSDHSPPPPKLLQFLSVFYGFVNCLGFIDGCSLALFSYHTYPLGSISP